MNSPVEWLLECLDKSATPSFAEFWWDLLFLGKAPEAGSLYRDFYQIYVLRREVEDYQPVETDYPFTALLQAVCGVYLYEGWGLLTQARQDPPPNGHQWWEWVQNALHPVCWSPAVRFGLSLYGGYWINEDNWVYLWPPNPRGAIDHVRLPKEYRDKYVAEVSRYFGKSYNEVRSS